jgi:transcriptional regulator with XRE-family HTH domain
MPGKERKIMWTRDKIKALRKAYKEPQETFAIRLGISLGALRVWEQDAGKPPRYGELLLDRLKEDLEKGQVRPLPPLAGSTASQAESHQCQPS